MMTIRITPAHAGKSGSTYYSMAFGEDHPRTRGEKKYLIKGIRPTQGSPPHTRGKERIEDEKLQQNRITPAHAGKRLVKKVKLFVKKDHPRTRGEKALSVM